MTILTIVPKTEPQDFYVNTAKFIERLSTLFGMDLSEADGYARKCSPLTTSNIGIEQSLSVMIGFMTSSPPALVDIAKLQQYGLLDSIRESDAAAHTGVVKQSYERREINSLICHMMEKTSQRLNGTLHHDLTAFISAWLETGNHAFLPDITLRHNGNAYFARLSLAPDGNYDRELSLEYGHPPAWLFVKESYLRSIALEKIFPFLNEQKKVNHV